MKPDALEDELLLALAKEHGTPLYVYDAQTIERQVRDLAAFDDVRYALKANGNLAVLGVVRRAGALVDAVSAGEIERALRAGWKPSEIAYTADLFDAAALGAIAAHRIPVNLGSEFQIEPYAAIAPGAAVTLRVNPGFGHGHGRKVSTGGPASKHGIWHASLSRVLARVRRAGLRPTGLHVHIGSGSDFENLARVCAAVEKLAPLFGAELERISAGGGLPIAYRPEETRFDVGRYVATWRATKTNVERTLGRPLRLEVEPGRFLVAEAGVLLCRVHGTKRQGRTRHVIVDAGFHTLLRPAMYGAWHRIRALGNTSTEHVPQVIAGPLCESGDVLTQEAGGRIVPRVLPELAEGDVLCIEDCGAYGMSMASNYNTQPFPAEVLVDGGRARLVRRRQRLDALLADELP